MDDNTMNNIKNMVDNGDLSGAISQISPEMIQNFSKILNQNNSNNSSNSNASTNNQSNNSNTSLVTKLVIHILLLLIRII